MKALAAALVAIALVALVAVGVLAGRIESGDGERASETRAVSGFDRIRVEGLAAIRLVQGDRESLTIDAARASLPKIRTSVEGGTLVIRAGQGRAWWKVLGGERGSMPNFTVNLRELRAIDAAGAVNISAASLRSNDLAIDVAGACSVDIANLDARTLVVDGAGAIKAKLAGRAVEQRVDLSGAGSYEAQALASERAKVDVSGAGKAYVNVAKELSVDISGAGVVEYSGDPKLVQSVSGAGRVRRAVERTNLTD